MPRRTPSPTRSAADELLSGDAARRRSQPEAAGTAGSDAALDELRRTLTALHRQVDRLVAESRASERKLRALREEIEMLKAIDLEPAAADPRDTPPRR
jgi:hypothetical protein